MRVSIDRLGVLTEYGLSDYQGRVYLSLLDFPSLSAGALAKASQVPRNRLYEVLEELQAIGLVEILLGETRMYRAKPLSSYLDQTTRELRDRISKIESQKSYMDVAFHPPDAAPDAGDLESGATRVAISRRAVAREIDRLVGSARESIVAASSVGGWERVFRHLDTVRPDDGPTVEVYVPRAALRAGGVERVAERWGRAVHLVSTPLRSITFAVDGREILIAHPVPDDEALRLGRDLAILTTDPAILADQVELLRAAAVIV